MSKKQNFRISLGDKNISELRLDLKWNAWPEFMHHDKNINALWSCLYRDFSKYQVVVYEGNQVAGLFNTLPIQYTDSIEDLPDAGLDWAFQKATDDFKAGLLPNMLVAVQLLIPPDFQGQGFSYQMLTFMKELALDNKLQSIALPVRPTFKSRHPRVSMQDYMLWTKEDQLPFDPWIRVHLKAGGRIIKPCDRSMDITGTIKEWEQWTGMKFSSSGKYIVKEALCPVDIDVENNLGRYLEPNLWILHELEYCS